VDLSPAMIEAARSKGGYDELHVSELCGFMRARCAKFDAVVAADTLVYFGALEEALTSAAACLKAQGLLVMTLERMAAEANAQTYRIEPHGRYTHRIEYVRSALVQAGFELLAVHEQVLRRERGEDVNGLVVVARAHAPDKLKDLVLDSQA
jgi:predicted TPR repeat methyltransferase